MTAERAAPKAAVQKATPYEQDMRDTPLSVIRGTDPNQKGINTTPTPRAPIGPRDDLPGMEGLSGKTNPSLQKATAGLPTEGLKTPGNINIMENEAYYVEAR